MQDNKPPEKFGALDSSLQLITSLRPVFAISLLVMWVVTLFAVYRLNGGYADFKGPSPAIVLAIAATITTVFFGLIIFVSQVRELVVDGNAPDEQLRGGAVLFALYSLIYSVWLLSRVLMLV